MLYSERSHRNEKPTHHNYKVAPHSPERKKSLSSHGDPEQLKRKKEKEMIDPWGGKELGFTNLESPPKCPQLGP